MWNKKLKDRNIREKENKYSMKWLKIERYVYLGFIIKKERKGKDIEEEEGGIEKIWMVKIKVVKKKGKNCVERKEIFWKKDWKGNVDEGREEEEKKIILKEGKKDIERIRIGNMVGKIRGEELKIGGDEKMKDELGDRIELWIKLEGSIEGVKRREMRVRKRNFDIVVKLIKENRS